MAAQQLSEFLSAVDPAPPSFVEVVAVGLQRGGFDMPTSLNKADPAEVISMFPAEGEGSLNLAKKAFIRRAIEKATMPLARPPVTAIVPLPPPAPRQDQLNVVRAWHQR